MTTETKSILTKRLVKELIILENVDTIEIIDYTNKKIQIILKYFNFKFKIDINIPLSYPFSGPSITINNHKYIKILQKLIINGKCCCCESLTCSNNWGPLKKIINIIDEIKLNIRYKLNKVYLLFIDKIINKHLGFYLPIREYLIL